MNDVKADINREMELDELRKLQQSVQSAAKEIETSMVAATKDFEAHARDVESALSATADQSAVESPAAAAPQGASAPPQAPAAAAPAPSEPPRQASLPGFDRG